MHSHSFQRALLASANSGVAEKSPDDTAPKRRDSREKLATLQVIPMNIEKCFVAHKMLRSKSHNGRSAKILTVIRLHSGYLIWLLARLIATRISLTMASIGVIKQALLDHSRIA